MTALDTITAMLIMTSLYIIGTQDPFGIADKVRELWDKLLHGGKR